MKKIFCLFIIIISCMTGCKQEKIHSQAIKTEFEPINISSDAYINLDFNNRGERPLKIEHVAFELSKKETQEIYELIVTDKKIYYVLADNKFDMPPKKFSIMAYDCVTKKSEVMYTYQDAVVGHEVIALQANDTFLFWSETSPDENFTSVIKKMSLKDKAIDILAEYNASTNILYPIIKLDNHALYYHIMHEESKKTSLIALDIFKKTTTVIADSIYLNSPWYTYHKKPHIDYYKKLEDDFVYIYYRDYTHNRAIKLNTALKAVKDLECDEKYIVWKARKNIYFYDIDAQKTYKLNSEKLNLAPFRILLIHNKILLELRNAKTDDIQVYYVNLDNMSMQNITSYTHENTMCTSDYAQDFFYSSVSIENAEHISVFKFLK